MNIPPWFLLPAPLAGLKSPLLSVWFSGLTLVSLPAAATATIEPQAIALLKEMSERLAQAQSLSFTAITN